MDIKAAQKENIKPLMERKALSDIKNSTQSKLEREVASLKTTIDEKDQIIRESVSILEDIVSLKSSIDDKDIEIAELKVKLEANQAEKYFLEMMEDRVCELELALKKALDENKKVNP